MASPPMSGSAPHRDAFSLWLDLFRWLSALAVVLTHVNNRFLVKVFTLPPPERTLPHYAYGFIASFGHQAVMIFFVLSGLLVGGSLWHELRNKGAVSVTRYVSKRLSRLWIVLLPSLILILILDLTGIYLFHGADNGIYTDEHYPTLPDYLRSLRPYNFVCNAVFLQTAACNQYGSDGALWSIYDEFWYYIVWPLLLLGVWPRRSALGRLTLLSTAAALLGALTYFQFVGPPFGPYMVIWLFGVVVAARGAPFLPLRTGPAAVFFITYSLAVRLSFKSATLEQMPVLQFLFDVGMATLFANLLLAMKSGGKLPPPPLRSLNAKLAGFSFSLYCIHTPILMCYVSALTNYYGIGWRMIPHGILPWLIVASAVLLCMISAYVFSLATERHTERVRRWVLQRLRRGEAPQAPPLAQAEPAVAVRPG